MDINTSKNEKMLVRVKVEESDKFFSTLKGIDEEIGSFVENKTKAMTQNTKAIVKADTGIDWETGEYVGAVKVPAGFVAKAKKMVLEGDFSESLKNEAKRWLQKYHQGMRVEMVIHEDSFDDVAAQVKAVDAEAYRNLVETHQSTIEWKNSVKDTMRSELSADEYDKWYSESLYIIAEYDTVDEYPSDIWNEVKANIENARCKATVEMSPVRKLDK